MAFEFKDCEIRHVPISVLRPAEYLEFGNWFAGFIAAERLSASFVIKRGSKFPVLDMQVRGISRCKKLIEVFGKHKLRSKKLRDFEQWSNITSTLSELPRGDRNGGVYKTMVLELIEKFMRDRRYEC